MAKTKRVIKPIGIGQLWFDLLMFKRPDLKGHGAAWAIEALIADTTGLPRPLTPEQARRAGARTRGEQLRGREALNKNGRPRRAARKAEE